MRPDRQQHGLNGGCFVRLQFIGQQSFLTVQFELVDKNTREVALFFRLFEGLVGGLDGFNSHFFVAGVQFFATRLSYGDALTFSISQTHKAQPDRL